MLWKGPRDAVEAIGCDASEEIYWETSGSPCVGGWQL